MRLQLVAFLCIAVLTSSLCAEDKAGTAKKKKPKKDTAVIQLFDGKTLKGWNSTKFGGEGEVTVKDGSLILPMGSDLTGVTWKNGKSLPRSNYEITFEAMRVDGYDFFCGLTLPIHKGHASLICGGWGGGVCGLSSIDTYDASENQTSSYYAFKNKRWYKFRIRVTDQQINAWIDKDEIIDLQVSDHKFEVRVEIELSQPLGFASFQTTAALKNIKLRKLTKADLEKKPTSADPAPTKSAKESTKEGSPQEPKTS